MKGRKIILSIILFFSIILINNLTKATVISVSPKNPKVGDTVTITITVPNVNTSSVVARVSGVVSGTIKVVDGSLSGEPSIYSKSASYKCTKEGNIAIAIDKNASRAVLNGKDVKVEASINVSVAPANQITNSGSSENSNTGSTGTNSDTIQTNQGTNSNQSSSNQSNNTQTKSSVAILGNLGIKPNDFSGFTPNKTSYSTTVPNSVSSIEVYAVSPQNQKQTISGTGKKQLKEGQNNFEIKVTAEDGKTTKTYKLTVTREKSNSSAGEEATGEETTENTVESNDVTENNNQEQNEENIESDEQKIGLSELKIEGLTLSPEFKKNVYEYNTKLEDDKESLEIIATPITEGSKVDITGNENLKDGENTITIIVSDESDENMATYQINVTKEKKQENVVNLTYKIIKENFVIVILVVTILIVIIILIVHLIKNKNSVYSGIYMPYEEGVTEHEDIHQNEFKKEKKNHAKMKKSKGKRFK